MNRLEIKDHDSTVVNFSTGARATFINAVELDGRNSTTILRPTDVLKVRDWFDERVRELIFQGLLAEHLGD